MLFLNAFSLFEKLCETKRKIEFGLFGLTLRNGGIFIKRTFSDSSAFNTDINSLNVSYTVALTGICTTPIVVLYDKINPVFLTASR